MNHAWIRRSIVLLVLGVLPVALLAGPASAHAELESSDPAAGVVLDQAPAKVTMVFTEPPDPVLSKVTVLNAGGQEVQSGSAVAGEAPRSLAVPLPTDLADGVYTVSWAVFSSADGHASANSFAFGVGVDPGSVSATPTQPTSTPTPSAASVAGKAMLYVGILLSIGLALAGLWTIGPNLPGRRWIAVAAGCFTATGALVMLLAERSSVGVPLGDLLSSDTGRAYVWLLGAALVVLVAAITVASSPARWGFVLLGVAGIVTAAARAAGGHAAAASPAWVQEAVQTLHMVAASVWVGGFVPILVLLRARRRAEAPAPVDEVRRFSSAAGWGVLVVVATGLVRVVNEEGGLGSVWSRLTDSSYGTTLIVKVSVVVVVIALGAWNRLRSIPRLADGDRLLSRVMTAEAAGALMIVVTTGLLTGLNPEPTEPQAPPAPASISATGSDFATTTKVALTATPGLAGPNDFSADVTDFDTGEPVVATGVRLRLEPVGFPVAASELDLAQTGSGAWAGNGAQLSLAGVWNVTVQVQTGSRTTEVPLVLTTRPPGGQQVSVVSQEGLPDIVTLTLAGGLQLQCYVDPGNPGGNDVHVTAFDASGSELPLSDVVVVLTSEDGDPRALPVVRRGAGHFSAAAELDAGSYRIDVIASAKDASVLQGWFTQDIADA
ncbi:MAG: copper resistance protein CopC [Actinomycetota bacterium]